MLAKQRSALFRADRVSLCWMWIALALLALAAPLAFAVRDDEALDAGHWVPTSIPKIRIHVTEEWLDTEACAVSYVVENRKKIAIALVWTDPISVWNFTGRRFIQRGQFFTQSLRMYGQIEYSLPVLHVKHLRPGERMKFTCIYKEYAMPLVTEFAYVDVFKAEDLFQIEHFDGTNSYGEQFEWLLKFTKTVRFLVDFPSEAERASQESDRSDKKKARQEAGRNSTGSKED